MGWGLVVRFENSPSAVKSSVFKHPANWVSVTFFMSTHFLLMKGVGAAGYGGGGGVGFEYSPSAVKSSVFKHLANWVSVTFFISIHFLLISLCRNPIPSDRCTASISSWICKIICLNFFDIYWRSRRYQI